MADNNGKVHELRPNPVPGRVPAATSFRLEQLPSGTRVGTVYLVLGSPTGPVVIGELTVTFQLAEHARLLQAGLGGLLNQLPPDIVRG